MHNPQTRVRKVTRVGLVVELLLDVERPGRFVQLVISIPGREGTLTRTWITEPTGLLDSAAVSDMCTYVDHVIIEGIMSSGGIEDRLPLG